MADLTVLQRETLNTIIMHRCPYRLTHREGDIAAAMLTLVARGLVRFDNEDDGQAYAVRQTEDAA